MKKIFLKLAITMALSLAATSSIHAMKLDENEVEKINMQLGVTAGNADSYGSEEEVEGRCCSRNWCKF